MSATRRDRSHPKGGKLLNVSTSDFRMVLHICFILTGIQHLKMRIDLKRKWRSGLGQRNHKIKPTEINFGTYAPQAHLWCDDKPVPIYFYRPSSATASISGDHVEENVAKRHGRPSPGMLMQSALDLAL